MRRGSLAAEVRQSLSLLALTAGWVGGSLGLGLLAVRLLG